LTGARKTLFLMTVQHSFYHTDNKHFPTVGYLGCFNMEFCFAILSNVAVTISMTFVNKLSRQGRHMQTNEQTKKQEVRVLLTTMIRVFSPSSPP